MAESKTPMQERFASAATGKAPTPEQRFAVQDIEAAVVTLAELIDELVPGGRNRSIALTGLEDVHMRANRGIFAKGPSA